MRIGYKQLEEIVQKQDDWDYNRQVDPDILKDYDPDGTFDLVVTMTHEHRHGDRCEPHYRTALQREDQVLAFIDVPIDYFKQLDTPAETIIEA